MIDTFVCYSRSVGVLSRIHCVVCDSTNNITLTRLVTRMVILIHVFHSKGILNPLRYDNKYGYTLISRNTIKLS